MEFRTYPEYTGNINSFQAFLLSYFDKVQMCYERHTLGGELHIHGLLLGNKYNLSPQKFKRLFQRYKKTVTSQKLRNNSFHVSNCTNDVVFNAYLMKVKVGGEKKYFSVKHPYDFDMSYTYV